MNIEETGYRSYLLRLWLVKQNDELIWRAILENPHSGQQHLFSSPEALDEFLRTLSQELERELEQ